MAVNNSIKVGPLVFLLLMFVITENIMKRPVFLDIPYDASRNFQGRGARNVIWLH
jgi:hypothetical protein